MATNSSAESLPPQPASGLQHSRVYQICAAALVVGFAIGYLVIGVQKAPLPARSAAGQTTAQPGMLPGGHRKPTMEQMKAMADVKAAPLLEKLKTDPKNAKLLIQVAALYNSTHQFKDAANYYNRQIKNKRLIATMEGGRRHGELSLSTVSWVFYPKADVKSHKKMIRNSTVPLVEGRTRSAFRQTQAK